MEFDAGIWAQGIGAVMTGPVGVAFSLTLLGALAVGGIRLIRNEIRTEQESAHETPDLPRELWIPVVERDPDQVARATVVNRVSHLVVEGRWDDLACEIAVWEGRLDSTPGGARRHEIAADACFAGLRNLLDEAPRESLEALAPADREVDRFAARLKAAPMDHILAVLAARAHMMVAETCRADFWPEAERNAAWRKMAHHYLRAEAILAPFDPVAYMSPLLAGAYYELALGMPDGGGRLRPAFQDWIDLDPSNPAIYARHVPSLLEATGNDLREFLAEAERAETRTAETLGLGGYALCVIPAFEEDPSLRDQVETDRLAAGLMDLARLSGTQAEVNWAAATLAREAAIGSDDRRAILKSAFEALVRRHLGVIYPRIWELPIDEIRAHLSEAFRQDAKDRTGADAASPPVSHAA